MRGDDENGERVRESGNMIERGREGVARKEKVVGGGGGGKGRSEKEIGWQ